MNLLSRALAALLCVTALAGCKLQIVVPANGSVTTSSGNYSCAAGQTCLIEVVDATFNETFTAVPVQGYTFVQWALQPPKGLCGGVTGPCPLATTLFAGIEVLLNFVRADDTYTLAPIFEPQGGGGGGGGGGSGESAEACFNQTLVTPGSEIIATYKAVATDTGTIEFTYDQEIKAGATYNGNQAYKAESKTTATGDSPSTSETASYFSVDVANKRIKEYGVEVDLLSPAVGHSKVVSEPYALTRMDLAAGEHHTTSWTDSIDVSVSGISIKQTNQISRTTTYIGRESVSVPGGTFDTCKFVHSDTVTGTAAGTDTSTDWFGVGNGMLIKQTSEDGTTELISATVNGTAI